MLRSSAPALLAALFLAACGSTTTDGPAPPAASAPAGDPPAASTEGTTTPQTAEPDHGAPSDIYPAPHPEMPQVVNQGGRVLKAPKVVSIFFKNDTLKPQLVDFATKIGASPYWAANTTEYGVGAVAGGKTLEVTDTPPATMSDSDVEEYMIGLFDGKHGDLGTEPDPETIYTIYYPSSTTISLGSGGFGGGGSEESCQSFGGYHDSTSVSGKPLVYAVIPECPDFGGLTGIDAVTATSSHEWLEAATDPHPRNDPAFASVDDDHAVWSFFLGGSETGDMCAQNETSFYVPQDLGFAVQRSWSNAAAKAGHDPCVPAISTTPYFNSAPVLPDTIKIGGAGQSFTTKGVKIPVGDTKTIEIDLFSDGPTSGPWTVKARSMDFSGQKTLDLSLDRDHGQNGEKVYLTIKAVAASQYKASAFMISSRLGDKRTSWVGMVSN